MKVKELKRCLGERHWDAFCQERSAASADREMARSASYLLRDYIRLVRIGDMKYGQAESLAAKGHKAIDVYHQSEHYLERALECLDGLLSSDVSLNQYLDRDFDYGKQGGICAPYPDEVPRIRYHKSKVFGYATNEPFVSLKSLKENALSQAIKDPQLDDPILSIQNIDSERLSIMLKNIKSFK